MPNILNQIPDEMAGMFSDKLRGYAAANYGAGTDGGADDVDDADDDDVPELVENFDEAAEI